MNKLTGLRIAYFVIRTTARQRYKLAVWLFKKKTHTKTWLRFCSSASLTVLAGFEPSQSLYRCRSTSFTKQAAPNRQRDSNKALGAHPISSPKIWYNRIQWVLTHPRVASSKTLPLSALGHVVSFKFCPLWWMSVRDCCTTSDFPWPRCASSLQPHAHTF